MQTCNIPDEYKHICYKDLENYLRVDDYLLGYTIPELAIIRKNLGITNLFIHIDDDINNYSNNPVKNKVICNALLQKVDYTSLSPIAFSSEYRDLKGVPIELPNPEILLIEGLEVTGEDGNRKINGKRLWLYDGTNPVIVSLPVKISEFPDYKETFLDKDTVLSWISIKAVYLNGIELIPDACGNIYLTVITEEEVDEKISTLKASIIDLYQLDCDAILTEAKAYTDVLGNQVTINTDNITSLTTNVSSLETTVNDISSLVSDLDSDLTTLENTVETYYSNLSSLYDNTVNNISTWETTFEAKYKADLAALKLDVATKHSVAMGLLATLQVNMDKSTSSCCEESDCGCNCIDPTYKYVLESAWATSPLVWSETSGATYIQGYRVKTCDDGTTTLEASKLYMVAWTTLANETSEDVLKTVTVDWGDLLVTEQYTHLAKDSALAYTVTVIPEGDMIVAINDVSYTASSPYSVVVSSGESSTIDVTPGSGYLTLGTIRRVTNSATINVAEYGETSYTLSDTNITYLVTYYIGEGSTSGSVLNLSLSSDETYNACGGTITQDDLTATLDGEEITGFTANVTVKENTSSVVKIINVPIVYNETTYNGTIVLSAAELTDTYSDYTTSITPSIVYVASTDTSVSFAAVTTATTVTTTACGTTVSTVTEQQSDTFTWSTTASSVLDGVVTFAENTTENSITYFVTVTGTHSTSATATIILNAATITAVTGVSLSDASGILNIGDSVVLTATVTPADATELTVTWTVGDSDIVDIINQQDNGIPIGWFIRDYDDGSSSSSESANTVGVTLNNSTVKRVVKKSAKHNTGKDNEKD